MQEAEDFDELVHSALSHLYDHAYLLRHPLARLVGGDSPANYRANNLRRILLDAIQDLKPPQEVSTDSPAWRHYQYLYLRYVEAKPVADIARDLAVTDRQTRRRHRDALMALCDILRERLSDRLGTSVSSMAIDERSDRFLPSAASPTGALLDVELERMRSTHDNVSTDVSTLVGGALATIAPLARARGVTTSVVASGKALLVETDSIVLREALLGTLLYVIEQGPEASLTISCVPSVDDLTIEIRISPTASSACPGHQDQPVQLREAERLLRNVKGSLMRHQTNDELIVEISLPLAQPRTILVVDDNPDMLQLLRRFLSGTSYRPILATSGDEALRLARETHPAGIVLDVMMPRCDGWEVLQRLRGDAATREIPVLVCTVLQQSELAHALGADGFLAKPINQRSLLMAIERCCRR